MPVRVLLLLVASIGATVATSLPARAAPPPVGQSDPSVTAGRVIDESGASIPGATIAVRPVGAEVSRLVTSGPDGRFTVAGPRGTPWLVTITHPGFSAMERVVQPGDPLGDVALVPAAVVEQVAVVSASRQAELRETLSSRVDVVTRQQMEQAAALTVADALQEMPGVLTRRGSETAGAAGEQVQGIDSRQVLVLIDGQPVIGARGVKRGGIVNLDRQSTGRLERVEVVKGASSALYGSDAIGGVINMVTRSPSGTSAGGAVSLGNFGDRSTRAEAGTVHRALSGLFTAERREHDGFDLTPTTWDTTGAPTQRTDGLAKVGVRLGPDVLVQGTTTGYTSDTQGRSVGELGPQADAIAESALNAGVTLDMHLRPLTTWQVRAYHARYDESSAGQLAGGTALPPGALEERLTKLDTSVSHVIGVRQQLQGGVEWWHNRYDGINRLRNDEAQQVTTGVVWAQHRLAIGARATLTSGVRLDRHSVFGSAVSPKLGLTGRLTEELRARVSYGRGFRAPDIGQLYYRFLNPTDIYQVIGNPSLSPETADSYQAGLEWRSRSGRARIGVNLFRNDVHDLIDAVSLGVIASPRQLQALIASEAIDPSFAPTLGRLLLAYRNIAEARTEGVEVDGDVALSRAWSLGGAYTGMRALDRATGLDLTNRHPHHGHLRLAWHSPRSPWRANLRGTFFSSWIAARSTTTGTVVDTRAPAFALWDAYVSRSLGRALTVFGAVNNLTDSQDPNTGVVLANGSAAPIYRPEAGRVIRAGLRVEWSRR